MKEYIYEAMQRAGIFIVLAQAIIQFRPNAGYEKYLRFLTSIMTAVILVFPVWELFQGNIKTDWRAQMRQYEEEWEQEIKDGSAEFSEENSYLYTMKQEIKTKLDNIVEEEGYDVKSAEIRDLSAITEKKEAGGIFLEIILKPHTEGISTIKVDKIKWKGDNSEDKEAAKDGEKKRMREKLAGTLGMSEEQLEVEILDTF